MVTKWERRKVFTPLKSAFPSLAGEKLLLLAWFSHSALSVGAPSRAGIGFGFVLSSYKQGCSMRLMELSIHAMDFALHEPLS